MSHHFACWWSVVALLEHEKEMKSPEIEINSCHSNYLRSKSLDSTVQTTKQIPVRLKGFHLLAILFQSPHICPPTTTTDIQPPGINLSICVRRAARPTGHKEKNTKHPLLVRAFDGLCHPQKPNHLITAIKRGDLRGYLSSDFINQNYLTPVFVPNRLPRHRPCPLMPQKEMSTAQPVVAGVLLRLRLVVFTGFRFYRLFVPPVRRRRRRIAAWN